ncbi:hypothetical protein C7974DRAFT_444679 [Boeremia exigua]|uniref:uncharacterized protein n=1 Tax=Boeremia exigua TaxID=749465 RepID=UPI001E8EF255|nr:uncharacterized protein C7974DRAFT_444679 [Boeremia exigua]KAH6613094.1 hypothetical protein C7974DRAFT_444679 [Boeremia exigua]
MAFMVLTVRNLKTLICGVPPAGSFSVLRLVLTSPTSFAIFRKITGSELDMHYYAKGRTVSITLAKTTVNMKVVNVMVRNPIDLSFNCTPGNGTAQDPFGSTMDTHPEEVDTGQPLVLHLESLAIEGYSSTGHLDKVLKHATCTQLRNVVLIEQTYRTLFDSFEEFPTRVQQKCPSLSSFKWDASREPTRPSECWTLEELKPLQQSLRGSSAHTHCVTSSVDATSKHHSNPVVQPKRGTSSTSRPRHRGSASPRSAQDPNPSYPYSARRTARHSVISAALPTVPKFELGVLSGKGWVSTARHDGGGLRGRGRGREMGDDGEQYASHCEFGYADWVRGEVEGGV